MTESREATDGLSIVIPSFNDQAGLDQLLPELLGLAPALKRPIEVLVIDDGSTTPLRLPVSDPRVRVLRHRRNRGYGASAKTGLRAARYDWALLLDSDGQHDPKDIPLFLEKMPGFDLVAGLRPNSQTSPLWRRPGKWILTRLFNALAPYPVKDINCGFRCFRRKAVLPLLPLCSNKFSFSISSTMLLMSGGRDVEFIPITPRPRIGRSAVSWVTGLETLLLIVRMIVLTEPLRFFLPISFLLVGTGVLWAIPYALKARGLSTGALFLMVSGLLILLLGVLSDQLTTLFRSRADED